MRFSIIIPVYNAEKYIEKCLDSVLNQTYQDFEIIIVNDGSKDNSQIIIDKYKLKTDKIISFIQENHGINYTRNFAMEKASGEYLVSVDSDDYIGNDYLETINKAIEKNNSDLIGINLTLVNDEKTLGKMNKAIFENLNGEDAIIKLINYGKPFDIACGFVLKSKYIKENNFKYPLGQYHEDYALMPKIVVSAKSVTNLDYSGYYYYQSEDSITRTTDYKKECVKVYDVLKHTDDLLIFMNAKNIKKENLEIIKSYLANAIIEKGKILNKEDYKKYNAELKKRKAYDMLISNTFPRKLKKIITKNKIKLGIK